jgi:hypothetical protein
LRTLSDLFSFCYNLWESKAEKYFTPERLLRLQDRSQEKRFLATLDDWENALEDYREYYHQIRGVLPANLRRLIDSVSLHDAQVIDLWPPQQSSNRARLTIVLQPPSDPVRRVVLKYSLLEPAEITQDVLPEQLRSQPMAWLYDELNAEPVGHKKDASRPRSAVTFTHNILFSNGWEVRLRFRNVQVERSLSLIAGDHHVISATTS